MHSIFKTNSSFGISDLEDETNWAYDKKIEGNVKQRSHIKIKSLNLMKITNLINQNTIPLSNDFSGFLKSTNKVEYKVNNGVVQVNLDDEENILKMNKREFAKELLNLNCCRGSEEFLHLLAQVQRDCQEAGDEEQQPKVLGVMDHMVDREWGQEIMELAQELNSILKLDITFVLLSSTDDKQTLSKQEN